jgi:beta-lactamase superfamily II metal-dependent hydrolase
MAVDTFFGETIQIDCGSSQGSKVVLKGLMNIYNHFYNPDVFMLSHFHMDHYNGLMFASSKSSFPNTWRIKEAYYPKIPNFPEKNKFMTCLFTINLRVFGNETGIMEYDFLKAISRINRGRPFKYKPLSKGDVINIDETSFEVLWPPAVIDEEKALAAIKNAINDFNKAMETDEELKKLYKRVEEEGLFRTISEEEQRKFTEGKDNPKNMNEPVKKDYEKEKLPEIVKKANNSLKKAANHLSLALLGGNGLLFLGDLESKEIKKVIGDLIAAGKKKFYTLVTPHHGTHWDNCLNNIECIYSITSNGRRLCSHIKPEFKGISRKSFATQVNGDIAIPQFLYKRFHRFYPRWFYDDEY